MYNIEILYKARKEDITLYDDCFLMVSESKKKATKEAGLKTLTSKPLLQRLPIALALTIALLNFISNEPDIDKIYLYAKDPYETKYQFSIHKTENVRLKYFNDPKAFIEYSNDIQDVYKNIDEYNIEKERKMLIVFDDMIADMINKKKLNSMVSTLFIRGRKLNTQSHFKVLKDIRLRTTQKRTSANCFKSFIRY